MRPGMICDEVSGTIALVIGWCYWIRRRKSRKQALAKEEGVATDGTPATPKELPFWKRALGVGQAPGYGPEAPRTYKGPPQAMKGYLPSRPW